MSSMHSVYSLADSSSSSSSLDSRCSCSSTNNMTQRRGIRPIWSRSFPVHTSLECFERISTSSSFSHSRSSLLVPSMAINALATQLATDFGSGSTTLRGNRPTLPQRIPVHQPSSSFGRSDISSIMSPDRTVSSSAEEAVKSMFTRTRGKTEGGSVDVKARCGGSSLTSASSVLIISMSSDRRWRHALDRAEEAASGNTKTDSDGLSASSVWLSGIRLGEETECADMSLAREAVDEEAEAMRQSGDDAMRPWPRRDVPWPTLLTLPVDAPAPLAVATPAPPPPAAPAPPSVVMELMAATLVMLVAAATAPVLGSRPLSPVCRRWGPERDSHDELRDIWFGNGCIARLKWREPIVSGENGSCGDERLLLDHGSLKCGLVGLLLLFSLRVLLLFMPVCASRSLNPCTWRRGLASKRSGTRCLIMSIADVASDRASAAAAPEERCVDISKRGSIRGRQTNSQ
eukprot:m.150679 g.150679  ORF g.150679 m.150679 type:complete len:459 (-) comp16884_c0_seq2:274-1650(-)